MADIDSPPAGSIPGDDRDKEAYQALEPHVAALARIAVETGCHETEVIAVLVSWALDRAIEGAGLWGAAEFLAAAQEKDRQAKTN